MDWLAIGLGTLVVITVVVYITWPWWMRRRDFQTDLVSDSGASAERLSKRREAILIALRDLDFDYAVDKITEEDYGPMRQTLVAEVATIMTQLDEEQAAAEASLENRIEAEILVVRQNLHPAQKHKESTPSPVRDRSCAICGRTSRTGDLYCRGCGTQLNPTCPECGSMVQPTDHFCAGCGLELALALSG